ncbi:hypothetical protein MUK42_19782, partial [Musa troglodytarum]
NKEKDIRKIILHSEISAPKKENERLHHERPNQTSPEGSMAPRYCRMAECFLKASETVAALQRPTSNFLNEPSLLALSI